MNVWTKHKITIKELLGENAQVKRNSTNPEKTKKELNRLSEEMDLPGSVIIPAKGR